MGLDIYFYERHYLKGKKGDEDYYPDVRVQEYEDWTGKKWDARIIKNAKYVVSEAGYFRKANQIQGFINDKYAEDYNGDINCKDVYLTKNVIMELYDICKELLAIKDKKKFEEVAAEKLPTCSGVFFGSTEYDEYYCEDLKRYIEMVDKMELDNEYIDYYYHCWY